MFLFHHFCCITFSKSALKYRTTTITSNNQNTTENIITNYLLVMLTKTDNSCHDCYENVTNKTTAKNIKQKYIKETKKENMYINLV